MINKNRGYHESAEKIASRFADKYFYNTFENATVERVTDKARQIKGVDTILKMDGKEYFIDEKCSALWRNLDTFILELTTKDRTGKNLCMGWFLNDNLLTTHYLFIFINKTDDDNEKDNPNKHKDYGKIKNVDSFKKVDLLLVSKQKIKDYLSTVKWSDSYLGLVFLTDDNLAKKSYNMRFLGDSKKYDKRFPDVSFSYILYNEKENKGDPEEPINVILPKSKYIELADVYKSINLE